MASNINISPQRGIGNHWEDWASLLVACWLFISPWILQFTPGEGTAASVTAAAWNAWISAVVIAALSVMALVQLQRWEEWTNAVIGIWVAASPWALGFSSLTTAAWNMVIVGVLVLCLAGWDLYESSEMSTGPGARA